VKKRPGPAKGLILEDHAEAAYTLLGTAAFMVLPDPEDRIVTFGALLEEAIRLLPKGERCHAAQSVASILVKTFPEPKGTAGLTPEPPLH
jgi:hypothetical protein